MLKQKKFQFSPGRIFLLSFLFVITIGTFLLWLPQSRTVDIPLIDLLFTSAASTCVTGLTIVPMSYFTTFGKTVILCLIQLGGLGLMTLSLFFLSLFFNLGMATQIMIGEMLDFRWSRIKAFTGMILGTTLFIELLASIYFYFQFKPLLPTNKAVFYAIFHSVSSFCNTGISLFENGILPFKNNIPFLSVTMFLVFMGSIGFFVWFEFANKIKSFFLSFKENSLRYSFSLHTKVVLFTSATIIGGGAILTWLLEQNNTLKSTSMLKGFFFSLFNTISLRSAGFELFSLDQIMPATLLLFIILIFIGGSPGSMAGGIKTTTFALFIATMTTIIKNKKDVEIFGRRIPKDQIYKAISIIVLSITWIFLSTFLLLIVESGLDNSRFSFIQIFFEVISSFSLCGLYTKITASFSVFGKLLIIITMLIGRIGSLTLIFALRKKKKEHLYHYPEEQIIIG